MPPALVDGCRVGPFMAGDAMFWLLCEDRTTAAALDAALSDLRVSDSANDRAVTFTVARRNPASTSHPWEVWRGEEPCERVTDGYLIPYVLWEVTRLLLDTTAHLTPIHGAAVARDGRALVLAGESHAGKSTLAGWLTAHGWEFLTDEVALVEQRPDSSWWVRPFPRPIGVRHPGPLDALLGGAPADRSESLVPASQLGRIGKEARLTHIVLPRRRSGAPSQLTDAHPATAIRSLFEHLPLRATQGRAGFERVAALALDIPAHTLDVDDLSAAEATLAALMVGEAE